MTAHLDPEAWKRHVKRRNTALIIIGSVLLVAGVLLYAFPNVIIPAGHCARAEHALSMGDKAEAAQLFGLAGDYRDAPERAAELAFELIGDGELEAKLRGAKFGDEICFGSYLQGGSLVGDKDPITWLVYRVEKGRALLVSEYILDSGLYNDKKEDITWEECSIREWLNETFYNEAFTENEKSLIALTHLANENNPAVNTRGRGGAATDDRVFLLGYNDFITVAQENDGFYIFDMRACPTAYARMHGVATNSRGVCSWLARTPGAEQDQVMYVDMAGMAVHSCSVDHTGYGIRPAIWVYVGQNGED